MNFTLNDSAINFELNGQVRPQLLQNSEFDDDSVWTIGVEGSFNWTFSGGAISVSLPSVFSSAHPVNQQLAGGIGTYLMLSQWTLSNMSGSDTSEFRVRFYDRNNNIISAMDFAESSNGTFQIEHEFTTLVPVARIQMWVWIFSGSTIDISVPFIRLYSPIYHSIFPINFTLNDEVVNFNLNAPVSILSQGFYRLLETGFYRLLEDGGRRLLEN